MRIMGLDVGSKTVGVAVSDPMGWTAQGIEIIQINEAAGHFGYKRVKQLIDEYELTKVCIGLPKNMNNTIGPRSEASFAYGKALEERIQVPVIYKEERLTTEIG